MIPDIAQRIEERMRKLDTLRQFAQDPEFVELFREFFVDADRMRPSTNGLPRRGDLIKTALRAARSLSGPFTVGDVLAAMKGQHFAFEAKKPEIAVGSALRKLKEKGKLKLVKEGKGRAPHQYALTQN